MPLKKNTEPVSFYSKNEIYRFLLLPILLPIMSLLKKKLYLHSNLPKHLYFPPNIEIDFIKNKYIKSLNFSPRLNCLNCVL